MTSAALMPLLAVAILASHAAALVFQLQDALHANVVCWLVESAFYAAAAWLAWRHHHAVPMWLVLAVGLALRLSILPLPPFHSTDIFRYVWDGRVQGAGINPYRFVPGDAALSALRDDSIWPRINRAGYAPTIYPPVAEIIFFVATRFGATVTAMKTVLVLFEAVAVWGMLRLLEQCGRPRYWILVYLWCPLTAWEFAGAGHVDAAMIAFLILACLAAQRGAEGMTGGLLAAAVLVKFLPLVVFPALWHRWSWRMPLVFGIVVVLCYAPYLGAGWGVFGFLPGYAGEEGLKDGSGFWIVRTIAQATGVTLPPILYVGLVGLGLLALALGSTRPPRCSEPASALSLRRLRVAFLLAASGMLALSPAYPWYFGWLVPALTLFEWLPVLWLIAAAPLLYWDNARTTFWMGNVVFGGALTIILWSWFNPTRPVHVEELPS